MADENGSSYKRFAEHSRIGILNYKNEYQFRFNLVSFSVAN